MNANDKLAESWFGAEILGYLGYYPPYTQEEILNFYIMQVELHDRLDGVDVEALLAPIREPESKKAGRHAPLPYEMVQFIVLRHRLGMSSPEISKLVAETFGHDMSSASVRQVVRRYGVEREEAV